MHSLFASKSPFIKQDQECVYMLHVHRLCVSCLVYEYGREFRTKNIKVHRSTLAHLCVHFQFWCKSALAM